MYVDAAKVISYIKKTSSRTSAELFKKYINKMPPEYVVDLIRCKDCARAHKPDTKTEVFKSVLICGLTGTALTLPDHFCSQAVRKIKLDENDEAEEDTDDAREGD